MLLLIESLIGIALFTLIVVPLDRKDPLAVIGDYPPAIRKRYWNPDRSSCLRCCRSGCTTADVNQFRFERPVK